MRAAASLLPALAVLVGCGLFREDLPAAAPSHGVDPAVMVQLSTSEGVGVRRAGAAVELLRLVPEGDRWREQVLASAPLPREGASVQFVAGDSETEQRSYVFGAAPGGAARVDVVVPQVDEAEVRVEGGDVRDGLWLAVIHSAEVDPKEVSWRFADSAGATLLDGSGTYP